MSLDFEQQTDSHEGIAAKFKEIVADANLLHFKQLLPNPREPLLGIGPRRHAFTHRCSVERQGQSAPVELLIGRQRKRLEPDMGRRHHVAR